MQQNRVGQPTPKITVLLADDHAVVRKGIRDFLEEDDAIEVVAEASDGAEAWRLLAHVRPMVAVLDIRMPEMTGIERDLTHQGHLPGDQGADPDCV